MKRAFTLSLFPENSILGLCSPNGLDQKFWGREIEGNPFYKRGFPQSTERYHIKTCGFRRWQRHPIYPSPRV